jgi:hypothetical protein
VTGTRTAMLKVIETDINLMTEDLNLQGLIHVAADTKHKT